MFASMDTNPETVEKREKVVESERTREGPPSFRDSGAKGRKVEKTENELGGLHKLPRHDCSKEGADWMLRLPRRERPGCS